MQTLYVPKYNLHYRVNPRNPRELQWSRKPFGPATQWQHAMSFKNPIRALDLDDETKQGVVVLNDSTTYVGSGVRTWGRKFYPAGTRIYSLYAIGESTEKKPMSKLKIKVREAFGAPSTPKELKNEMAKVISDFHKYIGEHKGNDRYTGTVAFYIDDLGYGSTEDDKKVVLDVIEFLRNELLQLKSMIEDSPVPENDNA